VNVDELFGELRIKHPTIGYSTVYRTLKLLAASGVVKEIRTTNRAARYLFVSEES
jgi:Fur family ferric uptake transcriptional regulator